MTIALTTLDDPPKGEPRGDGASLRYEINGELDADSSRAIQRLEFATQKEVEADSLVEIDLRRCSGMDDYGFGTLVGLIRRMREQDAHVQVRGADEVVQESLRRSGVDRLIDFVPEPTPDSGLVSEGARFQ